MAVSLDNIEYTGSDQRFFQQVVNEIISLRRQVASQQTLIKALQGRR